MKISGFILKILLFYNIYINIKAIQLINILINYIITSKLID